MRGIAHAVLLAAIAAVVAPQFEQSRDSIREDHLHAHLRFLSHDHLAGRAPGTPGEEIAGEYIAAQFRRAGLRPVDGSYFQDVALQGLTVDTSALALEFQRDTVMLRAAYPGDAVIWTGPGGNGTRDIEAELVFVGYGVDAPEWDWDDFAERDVRDRVLLFLIGDPPAPPEEPGLFDGRDLTYFGRWTYKLEEARRRGAAGALIVHDDEAAGYGWEVVVSSWTGEQLHLDRSGGPDPLPLQGWVRRETAQGILAAASLDLDELAVRAARRDFRPVPTGLTVHARIRSASRDVTTRNVVGLLPGKHPSRRDEIVVLTSHYDHLGTGAPVRGDSIYNGAYDNASGVSLLLEVAEAFGMLQPPTDRSLLFIATAAEEAGLLGSTYYTENPLFPLGSTVAALNTDGANLWGPTDDVIAIGADRSTLGGILTARAHEMGLLVRDDPAPERGSFFRSDHYPFARHGIPVLYLEHGLRFRGRPPGWGEQLMARYHAERYHRPGDEYDSRFDLSGAVQQARLLFAVGYDVANAASRPRPVANPAAAGR